MNDDVERDRVESWHRFCTAIDAAIAGDFEPIRRYLARPGVQRSEVLAFYRAVKEGTLVKVAAYTYRQPSRNARRVGHESRQSANADD